MSKSPNKSICIDKGTLMLEIDRLRNLDHHHRKLIQITGANPIEWSLNLRFGMGTLQNL
jgi:hypothetical protein